MSSRITREKTDTTQQDLNLHSRPPCRPPGQINSRSLLFIRHCQYSRRHPLQRFIQVNEYLCAKTQTQTQTQACFHRRWLSCLPQHLLAEAHRDQAAPQLAPAPTPFSHACLSSRTTQLPDIELAIAHPSVLHMPGRYELPMLPATATIFRIMPKRCPLFLLS